MSMYGIMTLDELLDHVQPEAVRVALTRRVKSAQDEWLDAAERAVDETNAFEATVAELEAQIEKLEKELEDMEGKP